MQRRQARQDATILPRHIECLYTDLALVSQRQEAKGLEARQLLESHGSAEFWRRPPAFDDALPRVQCDVDHQADLMTPLWRPSPHHPQHQQHDVPAKQARRPPKHLHHIYSAATGLPEQSTQRRAQAPPRGVLPPRDQLLARLSPSNRPSAPASTATSTLSAASSPQYYTTLQQ